MGKYLDSFEDICMLLRVKMIDILLFIFKIFL
jgi:hypothetical protein